MCVLLYSSPADRRAPPGNGLARGLPVLAGLSDDRRRRLRATPVAHCSAGVYKGRMKQLLAIAAAASVLAFPVPAAAQAVNFTLVNNTDIDFTQLMVRRFGSGQWQPLVVAPVPVTAGGGRGVVDFSDPDCAFDLQATLPDGRNVVWSGVNLCDAKVVILNRRANGVLWADYR